MNGGGGVESHVHNNTQARKDPNLTPKDLFYNVFVRSQNQYFQGNFQGGVVFYEFNMIQKHKPWKCRKEKKRKKKAREKAWVGFEPGNKRGMQYTCDLKKQRYSALTDCAIEAKIYIWSKKTNLMKK